MLASPHPVERSLLAVSSPRNRNSQGADNDGADRDNPIRHRRERRHQDVYVANQGSNTVSVLNGLMPSRFRWVASPQPIAANPLINKVYVANRRSGSVTIIDGVNPYNTKSMSVGAQPSAISVARP